MLAASVFYKDIANYIDTDSQSSASSTRSRDDPDPTSASTSLVGHRQLRRRRLLRLQRAASAQWRQRQGQGLHAELPAAVRRHRFRHAIANYTFADGETAVRQDLPYNSRNAVQHQPVLREGPVQRAHHLRLAQPLPRRRLRRRRAAGDGRRLLRARCELGWHFNENLLELQRDEPARRRVPAVFRGDVAAGKYKTGRRYMVSLHFEF